MDWYVIHTKPRQEQRALRNLEQQGYACYLPLLASEKLQGGGIAVGEEPLFPRYLFIRLDAGGTGQSWLPIRSTMGVSRLVTFGTVPAKVDDRLIEALQAKNSAGCEQPRRLFTTGERVVVTDGPFAGVEAIYQMTDGTQRVMVLIEMLSKPTQLKLAPTCLRKIG
jgi:transcriptional antiterminator RfaH